MPTETSEIVDYDRRKHVAAAWSVALGLLGLPFLAGGGFIWISLSVLTALVFLAAPKYNALVIGPSILLYALAQSIGFGPSVGTAAKSSGDFAAIGIFVQSISFGLLAVLGLGTTLAALACWNSATKIRSEDPQNGIKKIDQNFDDNAFEETISGLSFKQELPNTWFKESRQKIPKDREFLLYGLLLLVLCWSLPEVVGLLFAVDPIAPGTGFASRVINHQLFAFLTLIPLVARRVNALSLKYGVTVLVVCLMCLVMLLIPSLFYLASILMMFYLVGVIPTANKY